MNRIYLIASFFYVSILASAQLLTEPFKTAKDTMNGIVYTLPKTIVEVEVLTKSTEVTPGIYFQYAERFLGIKDFIQTPNIEQEITGYTIKTSVVPDLSQVYLISAGKKSKDVRITLTAEGYLQSINGNTPSVAKSFGKQLTQVTNSKAANKSEWSTKESSVVTKEMQQSSSTVKMAELAANQLFAIREARFNLLTQETEHTPSDGRSYEIVLSELNRMEEQYLELFQGKKEVRTSSTRFICIPDKETSEILFRFSSKIGILDKDNLGGEPIYIAYKKLSAATDLLRSDKSMKAKGLYYRVPSQARIELSDGQKILFSDVYTLNQFGKVLTLPASQIKSVELNPSTGSILTISK